MKIDTHKECPQLSRGCEEGRVTAVDDPELFRLNTLIQVFGEMSDAEAERAVTYLRGRGLLALAGKRSEAARVSIERRRALGIEVGRRLELTAAQYEQFCKLRDNGASIAAAARGIGVSASTMYNYRARFNLESWKAGDPWPPPLKAV